jgi:hypothetical protein
MTFPADERRVIARIIARAWEDEAFKQQLINDPVATLRTVGLALPEGVEYVVVENTASRQYIVIPPRPESLGVEDVVEDVLARDVLASTLTWIFTCCFIHRPPPRRPPGQ